MYEVSLADLQNDEVAFRKFKLIAEDVQGKNCLTNFHGMDLTRDKMCSMVKKWQVGRVLQRPAWYDAGLQFNFSAVGDLLLYWCSLHRCGAFSSCNFQNAPKDQIIIAEGFVKKFKMAVAVLCHKDYLS